jgi:hypothetical protein
VGCSGKICNDKPENADAVRAETHAFLAGGAQSPKHARVSQRSCWALERGQRKQTVPSPSRSSMTRITSACVAC